MATHDTIAEFYTAFCHTTTMVEQDGHLFLPNFRRKHLPLLFTSLGFTCGAEIGVARGHYSESLAAHGFRLWCVDPWDGCGRSVENQRIAYEETQTRLARFGPQVTIIKKTSRDAAADIPDRSLDFVYIDANHFYGAVMEDLTLWSRKVKVGGLVSGDDYYVFRHGGVIQAVQDFTTNNGIAPFYVTDGQRRRAMTGGQPADTYYRYSSFFWVNT
jgi:hypothetical protein